MQYLFELSLSLFLNSFCGRMFEICFVPQDPIVPAFKNFPLCEPLDVQVPEFAG